MKKIYLIFGLLILFTSCSSDDDCSPNISTTFVTSIEAPVLMAGINEIIDITINFELPTPCHSYEIISVNQELSTTTSISIRTIGSCSSVCAQVIQPISTNYEFSSQFPGEYELRFKSGENDFIILNLIIN